MEHAVSVKSPSLVRLTDVAKTFVSGSQSLKTIESLTLSIARGEKVAVVGPTGCGKSTLLRILLGIEHCTSGSVEWTSSPTINIVFQRPTLLPWRTVFENVALPLELEGKSDSLKQIVVEALREIGLEEFRDFFPRQLSGGMQARTALARALIVCAPDLLLLDECFSSVDEITRESLYELLVRLLDKAKTAMILVTHSIYEAALLCDTVVILSSRPAKVIGIVSVDLPVQDRLLFPDHELLVSAREQIRGYLRLGARNV
jgi:NitT/TauT family transport system ATP-binding protein